MSLNGGPSALICALTLWALGLYVLYWVIRLAVRHALTDTGVHRPAPQPDEGDPQSGPDTGQDDTPDWPSRRNP